MSLRDDFKEWNNRKKEAKAKMVDCPWANFTHKTWPDEICMRCNKKVDSLGNRIIEDSE